MNTYRVRVDGLEYEVQASGVTVAIRRGIQAYLKGVDINGKEPADLAAHYCKNRRKHLNKIADPTRSDESSYNVTVRVRRTA